MFIDLLSIVPGEGKNAANYVFDNIGEPFLYALIGLLVVFGGILVIIAVIWLIGLLMRKTDNLQSIRGKFKKTEKPEQSDSTETATEQSEEIPDEVKAAIIAAIMAYYQTAEPKCEFKVKRIKRI